MTRDEDVKKEWRREKGKRAFMNQYQQLDHWLFFPAFSSSAAQRIQQMTLSCHSKDT